MIFNPDRIEQLLDYELFSECLHTTKYVEQLLKAPTWADNSYKSFIVPSENEDRFKNAHICPYLTIEKCRSCLQTQYCNALHFTRLLTNTSELVYCDCPMGDNCNNLKLCLYTHYQLNISKNALTNQKLHHRLQLYNSDQVMERNLHSSRIKGIDTWLKISCLQRLGKPIRPPQWIGANPLTLNFKKLSCNVGVLLINGYAELFDSFYSVKNSCSLFVDLNKHLNESICIIWFESKNIEPAYDLLKHWGYTNIQTVTWVFTDNINRLLRTTPSNSLLTNSKKLGLIASNNNYKGNLQVDCDVIVSNFIKSDILPQEIYTMTQRLSVTGLNVELFANNYSIRPNWLSIGSDILGINITENTFNFNSNS